MELIAHFQMLARYNRVANEKLFEVVAGLERTEYVKQRAGSFGSIHGLLNHIMLGDRIWMARFGGNGHHTPPLNTVLFDDFLELRSARADLDGQIEEFFLSLKKESLSCTFRYINNRGVEYVDTATVAIPHFFNHQTHHRGQVHVMLSQTTVPPPSLDLHRVINP